MYYSLQQDGVDDFSSGREGSFDWVYLAVYLRTTHNTGSIVCRSTWQRIGDWTFATTFFLRYYWGKTLEKDIKSRHIWAGNGSNSAAIKLAPPPIENAHPTWNRRQRETNQVYMYFSAEHNQLHTTPPCYVFFLQEMAQTTQQKNGHLIQVTPLTAYQKQPNSHVFTCKKVLTAMWTL